VRVTGGGLDLENAVVDREQGHIEGATAEVIDENVALAGALLLEAIGDRCRGGLVDDAQHVEARDQACVLGRLALRVVEVGGDRDDRVLDLLAEVGFGRFLHLHQHHGGDLLGREGLGLALETGLDVRLAVLVDHLEGEVLHVGLERGVVHLAADEALGIEDGVLGVHSRLVLGGVADEALRVGERNPRRGGAVALVVGNDLAALLLPDADA